MWCKSAGRGREVKEIMDDEVLSRPGRKVTDNRSKPDDQCPASIPPSIHQPANRRVRRPVTAGSMRKWGRWSQVWSQLEIRGERKGPKHDSEELWGFVFQSFSPLNGTPGGRSARSWRSAGELQRDVQREVFNFLLFKRSQQTGRALGVSWTETMRPDNGR